MPDDRPVRLFARLRRGGFDCECPGCGRVYLVRSQRITTARGAADARAFDPARGLFRCTGCGRAYLLGLNFVPVSIGSRPAPPVDTVPTLSQAEELTIAEGEIAAEVRAKVVSQLLRGEGRKSRKWVNRGPRCSCGDAGPGSNPLCQRHRPILK